MFTSILIMFPITTYTGVIFLRIFAWCFIYHDPSHIFGGSGSTFAITTVLILIIEIIIYFIIKPFDKMIEKIKKENYKPTDEEKKKCLSSYRKFIIAIVIGNIIGFIVGQSSSTIVEAILGLTEFNPYLFGICLAQSIGVGANCALVIICLVNELMANYRVLLDIKSIKGFEKNKNASIRNYLLLTCICAVYLTMTNMIVVPAGLIYEPMGKGIPHIAMYIRQVMLAVFLNVIFCFIPYIIVLIGLKKRIRSTTDVIKSISEGGDLSTRIKLSMLDDFGQMLGSINDVMENLTSMLKDITQGTDSVNNSAQELSSISNVAGEAIQKVNSAFENINSEVSNQNSAIQNVSENANALVQGVKVVIRNVDEQAKTLKENSESIMRMTDNISDVAQLAQQADQLSKTLTMTSEQGNEALQAAVDMISLIAQSAEEVQDVIKQIQTIASQTNLLSMNASIEAAHAGEAGKGFSVVADEVRKLAGESAVSAKNIQIQMKEMAQKVKDGVQTINNAGEAFKVIARQVNETTQLVGTISTQTESQRTDAEMTMTKIKELLSSLESLSVITTKQGEYANSLMAAMDSVLESSSKTAAVIGESNSATEDLKNVLNSVEHSVNGNISAVETMKSSVSNYKIAE